MKKKDKYFWDKLDKLGVKNKGVYSCPKCGGGHIGTKEDFIKGNLKSVTKEQFKKSLNAK